MSVTLSVSDYLRYSGLAPQFGDISAKVSQFQAQLQQFIATESAPEIKWQYQVPELGEGGACSLFGQLADEPYDLSAILGGQTADN